MKVVNKMNITEIQDLVHINEPALKPFKDVYIGDLLSCVMSNINEESLWITTQTNLNVIAIGHLHDLAGIIFVEGMKPDEATIKKANECEIALFTYPNDAYSLALKISHYVL